MSMGPHVGATPTTTTTTLESPGGLRSPGPPPKTGGLRPPDPPVGPKGPWYGAQRPLGPKDTPGGLGGRSPPVFGGAEPPQGHRGGGGRVGS